MSRPNGAQAPERRAPASGPQRLAEPEIQRCLDALVRALGTVATDLIGGRRLDLIGRSDTAEGEWGAYLPLVGSPLTLYVGILTTRAGALDIARSLFSSAPGETPEASEVSDALGEVANMLGGGAQRAMRSSGMDTRLGLPLAVVGSVEPTGGLHRAVTRVVLGDTPASLVLLHGPGPT